MTSRPAPLLCCVALALPLGGACNDDARRAPAVLPAESLWQIEGAFEDHTGRQRTLPELAGEPALVAMFYATCPSACPMLIADVKKILAGLTDAERKKLRIVLVSLDPEHDTPEVLRSVVTTRGLDARRTTLLRTDASTTRLMASALGVRYRPGSGMAGPIDHTSKVVLVDRGGVIAKTRDDVGASTDALLAAIRTQIASP